jgi:antitoxin HicB
VLDAFAASGLTKAQLAIRLGKDEKEVRRILDPMHATKFGTLCGTLETLGRRMVIGVLDRDEAA